MSINNQQIQKIQKCSCCNNNNNIDKHKKPLIEIDKIANTFFTDYYKNVSNYGWTSVMYLFNPNCSVICKEKKFSTPYEFLNHIFNELIKRANYDNIKSKWVIVDDSMVMTVFGQMQFVLFDNSVGSVLPFAETFVIKIENGEAKCCSHILDF